MRGKNKTRQARDRERKREKERERERVCRYYLQQLYSNPEEHIKSGNLKTRENYEEHIIPMYYFSHSGNAHFSAASFPGLP